MTAGACPAGVVGARTLVGSDDSGRFVSRVSAEVIEESIADEEAGRVEEFFAVIGELRARQ